MPVPPESPPTRPLPLVPDFLSTTLEQRKRDARDIVSSFDENILPSEFNVETYGRITTGQSQRPSSEWTIMGDLSGTVMVWAVHDPDGWAFLNKWLSVNARTLLFVEKLQRRFQQEFHRYDEMANPTQHDPTAPAWSPEYVEPILTQIAENINSLVACALVDLDERPDGHGGVAQALLEVLKGVCLRSRNLFPPPQPGIQAVSAAQPEISLYNIMIRQPHAETSTMILEALERVSETVPRALSGMEAQFRFIGQFLLAADTPPTFRQRFWGLSVRAGAIS